MEIGSQLFGDSTVRLAQMLSSKYACMTGGEVVNDMSMNHLVTYSKGFVQHITDKVGSHFSAYEQEINYDLPEDIGVVHHISISREGY